MSIDHGEINIPLSGKRARSLDAEITRNVNQQRREKAARDKADRTARREAEATRAWFDRDQIEGAQFVRLVGLGWQRVIRVNAKTVTIPGLVDPLRIPFKDVLEVKAA